MMWANRNGLFYVLDRATGEFLLGKPFVKVNWMSGFDAKGKPIRAVQTSTAGIRVYPATRAERIGTTRPSAREPGSSIYRRGKKLHPYSANATGI
jgi:glucose dehydrogenase